LDRLRDRVAVVTGGGSGIGLATAHRLAAEGAKVVVVDVDAGAGEAVAKEVGGEFVRCDVSDEASVADLFDGVVDRHGRVDVAFNNAGISPPDDASVLDTSPEAWQRVQDVNLKSVFLCCKHGIPHLLESGGGSVINTASFVAVMGAATSQISYTASKGGVLAMSRELGVEFARQGVRVNALCPGPVDTPLLQELYANDPEQAMRRMIHLPMGRFAQAREIAQGALFLASDESSYVTASTFLIDGGLSGAYVTPL
jgi:NAD(P)-dependent dehydrogenase (short-subunit alcohol dehydrogenase family)